jgi:hypothetical protein
LAGALLTIALPVAADEGRSVTVLTDPERPADQVLIDALRIYTRDLDRNVRTGGPPPTVVDAPTLARLADEARSRGDEVVVWLGARDARERLYALCVDRGDLRETSVEPGDPLRTARTLALKVRALLTAPKESLPAGWSDAEPDEGPLAPRASETDAVPQTPAVPAPVAPSALSAPSTTPTLHATTAASAAPRRALVEATATYGVIVPTQTDWLRHGLTVRLALPLAGSRVAVFADASFDTAPSTTRAGAAIGARIWPVGVGAAVRLRRPRWRLALGPRVSLQIVDADASTSDGRTGSARGYSAGLGVYGEAAWLFHRHIGAVASVTAEALVPRLALEAAGSGDTNLGWAQFGVSVGLEARIP